MEDEKKLLAEVTEMAERSTRSRRGSIAPGADLLRLEDFEPGAAGGEQSNASMHAGRQESGGPRFKGLPVLINGGAEEGNVKADDQRKCKLKQVMQERVVRQRLTHMRVVRQRQTQTRVVRQRLTQMRVA